MIIKREILLQSLCFVLTFVVSYVISAQIESKSKGRYSLDLHGCAIVEKQCPNSEDDLGLLWCALYTLRNNKSQITFSCQHQVWSQQVELLDNAFLEYKLRDTCVDDPLILDCLSPNEVAIDCVLKKKPSIRSKKCLRMIHKIESLLFNDWQITSNFLKNCMHDIQLHSCGRIPPDSGSLSQIQTMKCLQGYDNQPECQSEISDLNAIKYSTLQLDKIIFAACNLDQKNFCPSEEPESLLLYKCLVRHKYEKDMTKRCKDQMFYDQRNMIMNYRMSKGLVKSCKDDIRKYRCRKGVVDDKDVRLAQILLCLEHVLHNESATLSSECTSEMTDHRKMLMDDYRLSPELMQDCANDITNFCRKIETGGKTIHCLMEYARPRKRKDKRISAACHKSLKILMEEVNPGEDWRVDPILRKACKPVVDKSCSDIDGGNGRVMSCLMEKLGTNVMTNECETALLQIQYFISRDFKLDPQLYKACKYDAVTFCKAKLQWADASEQQSEKDPLVLPCLYKYAYNSDPKARLRPGCEQQVKRVMRQRAISVDLLPEIEDVCIDDLANKCFENTGKGEEIQCLQQKLQELSQKCKEVVTNFTEMQSGHIELNVVVNTNCRDLIDKFCSKKIEDKNDNDDIMECLISHKNDPEVKMNSNCHAAIEHEQLISLKNYKFTRKFKNACKNDVVRSCPNAQTKSQVVACLSETVRNDTITKRKYFVSKECRQQLRSQLFQQKENIDFDPELSKACKDDLAKYCPNVHHGESAALECLQTIQGDLSRSCRRAIFIIKKQEFQDNAIDYNLMTSCNSMIYLYCHDTKPSKMLDCLKLHHLDPNFDNVCKAVVINRMIEQNLDYRFNTDLQNACNLDIKQYCSDIIKKESQDVELQGKVLYCLKSKFRESKLTTTCENKLASILKDQALNYRLNPLLSKLCKAEILTICKPPKDVLDSDGHVEECLKKALLSYKIVSKECAQEVVHIIEESKIDIGADPLLERACALDLLKHCKDVDHGAGRRLTCLKIILNDSSRKLEPNCEKELSNRLEMYMYVAKVVENFSDVYTEISLSPSKKYFLLVGCSIIGLVFLFGLYFGRVTKKAMYIKKK